MTEKEVEDDPDFGREAGVGASHPVSPGGGHRASCPHWRVSGTNAFVPRLCSRLGKRPVEALFPRMPPTGAPGAARQWSAQWKERSGDLEGSKA